MGHQGSNNRQFSQFDVIHQIKGGPFPEGESPQVRRAMHGGVNQF